VQAQQVWDLREVHENRARRGHFLALALVQMLMMGQGRESRWLGEAVGE